MRFAPAVVFAVLLFLTGCESPPAPKIMPSWDPIFYEAVCQADGDTPLLDKALSLGGLAKDALGIYESDLSESTYFTGGYLKDEFLLSRLTNIRKNPVKAGCFEGEIVGPLDYALTQPHPVAGIIRHAAELLNRASDENPPFTHTNVPEDFDILLKELCETAGEPCGEFSGSIPQDLAQALRPLLRAIREGISARKATDAETEITHDPEWWHQHGGRFLIFSTSRQMPDFVNPSDRKSLLGEQGRRKLYRAASQVAFAVEDIDWTPFVGRMGVSYDVRTKAGWIRIRDGADNVYEDAKEEILLFIDLGGNDVYLNDIAANVSADNSVSVAIDLGGNDIYRYREIKIAHSRIAAPPLDEGGAYDGDETAGAISLSDTFRQGAGRNGIAMLFDFGNGNDSYYSLRGSQGYAQLGVGVLFDAGGNDKYVSEFASQGSAQFGIGLLIDTGKGNDTYSSFSASQGFGFTGGAGILIDDGGDDSYTCNQGDKQTSGMSLYYAPQTPGTGNSSFCQGVGKGLRFTGPQKSPKDFFSGGIGILRDMLGNDTYRASVYAQGTGYWQAIGILSDGDGNDQYEAHYYAQGSAVHYAIGILADGGIGGDKFNVELKAQYAVLGIGHDFGVGVLINENGNDTYNIPGLSAGASNCNAIGIFIDNGGNDLYDASSDYGSGMGNHSSECAEIRPNAKSVGIMIDAGGEDIYIYPKSSFPVPGDKKKWGHKRNGLPAEYGIGIDDNGETGIHGGNAPVENP